MIQLLIFADDFTGALDTGVQMAASGATTRVLVGGAKELAETSLDCSVLVLDAETRHLSAEEAYRVVYDLVKEAVDQKIPYFFKKTDSALRGNVGAEMAAVLDATGKTVFPFIPAFPQIGRTTEHGIHLINGVEVADSVFGSDPFEPVTHSRVSELIGEQTDLPVRECPVPTADTERLAEEGIFVFDSSTEDDLRTIGTYLKKNDLVSILAGCAGFGAILPEILPIPKEEPSGLPELDPRLTVICGTVNPITLTQLERAEAAGFCRMRLTPEQKLTPGYWETIDAAKQLQAIRQTLQEHDDCIIDSNNVGGLSENDAYAKQLGMDLSGIRLAVARSLGSILQGIFDSPDLGTLLITGGDTLLQCMQYMGVTTLEPICEVEPGIVLSRFEYEGTTRYVMTKSGGFGPADLFEKIARKLRLKIS